MKRLLAMACALLMIVSASGALAAEYTAGNYYKITYPDTMTLDDEKYDDESDDAYQWLFILDGDGMVIDATIQTASGYEGDFSLYSAGDEEKEAYIDEVMDSFSNSNPTYLTTVEAGSVPFFVFLMEDTDGPFYYAETIAAGSSLNLYCYYSGNTEPDEALMTRLTDVLESFDPAS